MGARRFVAVGGISIVALLVFACGSGSDRSGFDPNDPNGGGGGASSGDPGAGGDPGSIGSSSSGQPGKPGCTGLACQVHDCGSAAPTTVSGVVYDPAGKNPLYNVVVYVPNAPVQPLTNGATCDSCSSLYTGSPIVAAVTDAQGKFTLTGVPDGKDIPLVIQVGKWRKQMTVPSVAQCAATALPDKTVKLPKNHAEGDIPNIAISTGAADSLECLLRRVGVDASEYGGGASGAGHIHIFSGGDTSGGIFGGIAGPNTSPPGPSSNTGLWSSKAELMKYDMVLLSCEGNETSSMNQQALFDYAAAGGRVFSSHFHYAWFNSGPFGSKNLASWSAGTNDMGDIKANIVTTLPDGSPFAKGQALHDWLGNVGALTGGELAITQAKHNADVGAAQVSSQSWITADSKANPKNATQYFTFNTPIGAKPDDQCGRVVFSDLHVGAASGDYGGLSMVTPDGCGTGDLSPQEKALEFMLFDLSSCVTPDDQPPPPPPTVK
jgi:hypothetical protein